MTERDIRRRLRWRNAIYLTLGIVLIPTAVGLWYVSFWAFRYLFAAAIWLWLGGGWDLSFYLAWGALAILAIDGFRYTRPLFDLNEYSRSAFYDTSLSGSATGLALRAYAGNPLGQAWLLSQLLYLAPLATVYSWRALRSRVAADAQVVSQAAALLERLTTHGGWVSTSDYHDYGAALFLLDRLDLIRSRIQREQLQIRAEDRSGPDIA